MTILLHGRSAACGVDHDGVHVGRLEGRDHRSRQCSGLLIKTGVQHECSATLLRLRNDHLAAFRGKHSGGGLVYMLEEDLLHAAGEHANPPPRLGNG